MFQLMPLATTTLSSLALLKSRLVQPGCPGREAIKWVTLVFEKLQYLRAGLKGAMSLLVDEERVRSSLDTASLVTRWTFGQYKTRATHS